MSRSRFGALLALLAVAVGIGAFAGMTAVLDDGSIEPTVDAGLDGGTTTSSTTSSTVPGQLLTPTFVVVVSSEGDQAAAQGVRDELTESGYDAGVLRSDDYPSLDAGFWVAYAGPFASAAEAETAQDALLADGFAGAYPRCVGELDECG